MIEQYGWSDLLVRAFASHARAGHAPGRIVVQHRDAYLVATDEGELRAKVSGRLLHEAGEAGHPAVGDWVALSLDLVEGAATIHAVLPRRTAFVRRAADSLRRPQVIAANIEVAFVVTSLNADLNPRRIERYLAAAWQSGARPVVVLTKADLCADPQGQVAQIAALAAGCPVLAVSARQGLGLDALLAEVRPGETCVLIGSSGVGKSPLVNAFRPRNLPLFLTILVSPAKIVREVVESSPCVASREAVSTTLVRDDAELAPSSTRAPPVQPAFLRAVPHPIADPRDTVTKGVTVGGIAEFSRRVGWAIPSVAHERLCGSDRGHDCSGADECEHQFAKFHDLSPCRPWHGKNLPTVS